MELALPAVDEASDEDDEVCVLKLPAPNVRCFGEQSRDGVDIFTESVDQRTLVAAPVRNVATVNGG